MKSKRRQGQEQEAEEAMEEEGETNASTYPEDIESPVKEATSVPPSLRRIEASHLRIQPHCFPPLSSLHHPLSLSCRSTQVPVGDKICHKTWLASEASHITRSNQSISQGWTGKDRTFQSCPTTTTTSTVAVATSTGATIDLIADQLLVV